jgi:hypothetical protein
MSRTFLWEAEQVARMRAPEYLAAHGITSVSADGIVNIALHGGYADQEVRRLAANLLDRAHAEAVRRWAGCWRITMKRKGYPIGDGTRLEAG